MKKELRETQALRAGCSKADPKNFDPPQTPFPGAQDGQNLNSWVWSRNLQTTFGENRCTQFGDIIVTDTARTSATNTGRPPVLPPQTGSIAIHCAAMLSAQCNHLCDKINILPYVCVISKKVTAVLFGGR